MSDGPVPAARDSREFSITSVGNDELMMFDIERLTYHSLNAVAASIWQNCDGDRSAPELTEQVNRNGLNVSVESVKLGAYELSAAGLLSDEYRLSRRELIAISKKLGAGIALATVISVSVPDTALAAYVSNAYPCVAGDVCIPGPDISGGTTNYCCAPSDSEVYGSRCVPVEFQWTDFCTPTFQICANWGTCF